MSRIFEDIRIALPTYHLNFMFRPLFFLALGLLCSQDTFCQVPSGVGWLGFTENAGQVTDLSGTAMPAVRYAGETGVFNAFFMEGSRIAFVLEESDDDPNTNDAIHRMDLFAYGPNAQSVTPAASGLLPHMMNYYAPTCGISGCEALQSYTTIHYPGMFPGVDVTIEAMPRGIAISVLCQPGSDPNLVSFGWEGLTALTIDLDGNFHMIMAGQEVVVEINTAYQIDGNGQLQPLSWTPNYVLNGNQDALSFSIGAYDTSLPLVIQVPESSGLPGGGGTDGLCWSTHFGGNRSDGILDASLDGQDNLFVSGHTRSTPTTLQTQVGFTILNYGAFQQRALIAGFGNDHSLTWISIIGGANTAGPTSGRTVANAIKATDTDVFVGGFTEAQDLWTMSAGVGYFDGISSTSMSKGFLARFDNATGTLSWSTYFGDGPSEITGLDIDAADRLVICGNSTNDLPSPPAQLAGATVLP